MDVKSKSFQDFFKSLQDYIVELGNEMLAYRKVNKLNVTSKEAGDVVTDIDLKLEKNLSEFILKAYPEIWVKGEENGLYQISNDEFLMYKNQKSSIINHKSKVGWLIDPIDGSKAYVPGVPMWTVSVALVDGKEPLAGIIYNPSSKQLYTAIKDQGSYLNGGKLEVLPTADSKQLQVSFDMTYKQISKSKYETRMMELFDEYQEKYYRVRLIGSGTLSLCWLAQGFFGAYVSPFRAKNTFLDIAAGLLIASEAGATVKIEEVDSMTETIIVTI